ncbi:hypothetical protein B9Q10_01950 [Candidatus Marsarchaeota G2 archaeon ECH_B_SAG-E12]|uniref:Uncharacterized protein n=1 Tax=Candidatus Marsarchaeota G2 archaeon ECH_B_SAG-E12 TaxID=1978164 RepID=A0A2R6BTA3_9ARCH|nr:MAG: hypothetical protein B9Q10_01950 [Candidatus Marsarchaeota G2 archaeon ECH_B_SAG-E12]
MLDKLKNTINLCELSALPKKTPQETTINYDYKGSLSKASLRPPRFPQFVRKTRFHLITIDKRVQANRHYEKLFIKHFKIGIVKV